LEGFRNLSLLILNDQHEASDFMDLPNDDLIMIALPGCQRKENVLLHEGSIQPNLPP